MAPPSVRIEKACVVCGTPFVTGGRLGKASKEFCSWACRRAARYRRGAQCAELSPMDAAYLAGFWDADGTFILHGRGGTSNSVSFRVHAGGTRPDVIQWIREVTGIGTVARRTPKNPNAHDVWVWTVNGDAAETFARQIVPYLRLKKERAELGIAFQERLRDRKLKADRGWQMEWMERLREMNRKGRDAVEVLEG